MALPLIKQNERNQMRAIFIVLLLSSIISCERVEMISEHKTIDEYTITYSATDGSGNKADASAMVTVPHNK